jgi:hypothetical protein
MTLGRAYWLTGDELFAETFVSHLSSWMDGNPPKQGINWASSLEVSFRAISWLWALYFFKDSKHLTAELFLRALKFLYLHARHLETYLSTYFSPNTHLTGEALGLFYLGTLLPELSRAVRWRATGRRILLDELDRHVRADGVYFEQSSYYHRYTTDFYTHFYLLSSLNGEEAEPKLEEKLKALLDHLMYITRPDGTTPFFGDDDGGRLVMLDERAAADFRAALSTGALLFSRGDYRYVAGSCAEETLWLVGAEGVEAFDKLDAHPPAFDSRAFASGGYYVMRDGWTPSSNYLLVDCGPHGGLNCGHAHSDALAFELAAGGRTLLVDPGTYTYTGSAEMRNYFRSTAAHNTLTVDEESQSVPGGAFDWKTIARARARQWISRPGFDFFEGAHDGYERLSGPATHVRSILFMKGDYWIVRDRVETRGAHHYDLHFHFAPHTRPEIDGADGAHSVREECTEAAAGLDLFAFGRGGRWHRGEGFVSPCYGQMKRAPVCTYSASGTGTQDFISFLMPESAGGRKAAAREIEAAGGRAFTTEVEGRRDILLLSEGALMESAQVASDFEWTWARYEEGEKIPSTLLLINGRRLALNGREAIDAPESIPYLFMGRIGDELFIDSESRPEVEAAAFGAARLFFSSEIPRREVLPGPDGVGRSLEVTEVG